MTTTSKNKFYTSTQIQKEFDRLKKDDKIGVLFDALTIMSQANWRSEFDCIALAMGYMNTEGDALSYFKTRHV
jgi:hypothetical protein